MSADAAPADAAPADAAPADADAARDHALVARSGALLAVVDAEGRLTFASPALARLLGDPGPRPWIGRPVLDLVEADDVPRARALRRALAASPGAPVSGELRLRHPDGTPRTIGLSAEDLRGDPAVRGFVVAACDLTERRAREAQRREHTALEAVGRLASRVAHDLNNLLMIVGGNTQLLRARLERAGLAGEELGEVEQAVTRATELTRQLLAVGRTRPRSAAQRVDAAAVVRGLAPALGCLVGDDVTLALDLDDSSDDAPDGAPDGAPRGAPHVVPLDAAQLEQLVLALVGNARDAVRAAVRQAAHGDTPPATPPGHVVGIALRVVRLAPPAVPSSDLPAGPYVVLTVADTGAGVDAATRERMFEPFFSTRSRGEGTGLGLSLVWAAARQAGGTVRVESAAGTGTTVAVLLPLLASAEPTLATPEPAGPAARAGRAPAGRTPAGRVPAARRPEAALPTGDETVLLVEDEPAVRAVLRRVLARLGYAVLEAEHGAAALARLREQGVVAAGGRVALVLSDVVMPEMGAEPLLEGIRREFPQVPVVLMSGYNETSLRGAPEGRPHPFAGIPLLEKPLTPEVLAHALRAQLDRVGNSSGNGNGSGSGNGSGATGAGSAGATGGDTGGDPRAVRATGRARHGS